MDTTLVPLNVAQLTNSLQFMGSYMTPIFSALWPLAAISVAISLVALTLVMLKNLIIWLMELVSNINFFHIRNNYDIKNDYNIDNTWGSGKKIGGSEPVYKTGGGKIITASGKEIKL